MLELNNIYLTLNQNSRPLVKNLSYVLDKGNKTAIIGEEGNGKSTLMKRIYEEFKTREDINLGYMPQNYEDVLNLNQSALDFLKIKNIPESEIRSLMGNMKFTSDEMTSLIKELSGGQRAKLLLIKMILDNCNVLLLDEPTRNLSPLSNPVIRSILTDYNGTIISVSHDRKYIQEVCQKAYWLDNNGLTQISIEDAVLGKKPKVLSK